MPCGCGTAVRRYGHIFALCKEDKDLQQLIRGVIHRQVICILRDPYANAFYKDASRVSEWKKTDVTDMKPGIHERKWEIDSLCYPIRLAYGYWEVTGDASPFDADWLAAMGKVLQTFREQQRKDGQGPYSFQRYDQLGYRRRADGRLWLSDPEGRADPFDVPAE